MIRILFVGEITPYSRSRQRLQALRRLGHVVDAVSYALGGGVGPEDRPPRFIDRVRHRMGRPSDRAAANRRVRERIRAIRYDVLWVDKGLCIRPSTLEYARASRPDMAIVFSADDDMFARHNQSNYFRRALPLYDVVFTAKSFNARDSELPALGARRCLYFHQGFDPTFHRPVDIDDATRRRVGCAVGFIGTWERSRAESLLALAREGLSVRVFGNGWDKWRKIHRNLLIEGRPIYGKDYVQAICATDVNLGFLRKANRDLHTSRSLDIPACGAYFLAERTAEHQQLFEEGTEAEYFSNQKELSDKATRALEEAERRAGIGRKARERCLKSGYSHDEVLKRMLDALEFPV